MTGLELTIIWNCINEYADACGGDTSERTVSQRRMAAVSRLQNVMYDIIHSAKLGDLASLARRDAAFAAKRVRLLEESVDEADRKLVDHASHGLSVSDRDVVTPEDRDEP